MKRFLSGFTLAEILVTIGLIGVVAAMTLPALSLNVQKHQVGPALLKAVNTLENGSRLLLQRDEARNLIEACGNYPYEGAFVAPGEDGLQASHYFPTCMVATGIFSVTENSELRKARKNNGTTDMDLHCVDGNDGISFCQNIAGGIALTVDTPGRQYHGTAWPIYIDINGPKATNTVGKDIFKVWLDAKGIVIPEGGSVFKNYMPNQETILWKTEGTQCTSEKIDDGESCAGAIADNGWKVNY